MKRNDFKKIIKIMSDWRIDKRKGNYLLPSGERLSGYVRMITERFLNNNGMAISENGNIYAILDDKIFIPFARDEKYDYLTQSERIEKIVKEMIY